MMKIKKLSAALSAVCITVSLLLTPLSAAEELPTQGLPPTVTANQYVLMDAETGQILLQKDMDVQVHPASTTKIVTAALALTGGVFPEEAVTVSNEAIDAVPSTSSHMAIDYGEILSFKDLIYGTVLYSANDAANAIAETMAVKKEPADAVLTFNDRIAAFAAMMNEYAASAGATATVFTNSNGLYEESHVTTAHDMALILKKVITIPEMLTVMQTVSYTVPATNKKEARDYITTGNLLIKPGAFNYPACIAGKTGYTDDSGYSFVAAAEKNGRTYIVSLYNCADADSRFADAIKLFDYAFNCFKEVTVQAASLPKGNKNVIDGDYRTGTATVYSKTPVTVLLHFTMDESSLIITDLTPEALSSTAPSASFEISVAADNGYMYDRIGKYDLTVNIAKLPNPVKISGTSDSPETPSAPSDPAEDTPSADTQNKKASTVMTVVLIILFIFLAALIAVTGIYLYTNISRQKRAKERRRERLKEREVFTKPEPSREKPARTTPKQTAAASKSEPSARKVPKKKPEQTEPVYVSRHSSQPVASEEKNSDETVTTRPKRYKD